MFSEDVFLSGGNRQDKEPSGSPLAASIEATTPPEPRKRMSRKVVPAIYKVMRTEFQHFVNRFMGHEARDTYTIGYTRYFLVALAGLLIKDKAVIDHIDKYAQVQARTHCQTRDPHVDAVFQEMKKEMKEDIYGK